MEWFAVDPSFSWVGFVLQFLTQRLPQLRVRRLVHTGRRPFSLLMQVMRQVSWWTRLSAPVWTDVFYLLQEMVAHQSIHLSCSRQWIPWPDWLLPCLRCRNSSWGVPWIRFRVSRVHRSAPVGTNVCSSVWLLEERSFSRKRCLTSQSLYSTWGRYIVRTGTVSGHLLVMTMKFSRLRRQSVDLTIRLSVMIAAGDFRLSGQSTGSLSHIVKSRRRSSTWVWWSWISYRRS